VFVPCKVGSYYLYKPAGGGGMGSVYKAVSTEYPGEFFAVKVLPAEHKDDPELGARLEREARTAALFYDVPNCENAVEFGFSDGRYFFSMEYIDGERLDFRLERSGPLPWREAALIAARIAEVDHEIYRRGYLYRDIKPENVILHPEKGPHLVDFGLCIPRKEARHSPPETTEGSVFYIPPERVAGLGEDCRSEVYSLGLLLFHTLTGVPLFNGDDVENVAVQHVCRDRLDQCRKRLESDIPEELCRLLMQMVPKRREQRLASLSQAARRLRQIASIGR